MIMADKFTKWEDFEKELNITPEQEAEIRLEMELIEATIEARKKCNLSQRELSEKSGIKQPAIARIEKQSHSPQVATLMHLLYSMGYTLRVVLLEDVSNLLANAMFEKGGSSDSVFRDICALADRCRIFVA